LLWGRAAVVTIYSVQEHCIMADMFEITAIWRWYMLKYADQQSPDWSQLGGRCMAPHGALDGSKQCSATVVRDVTWFDFLDMHWLAACVSQI
jgi:hypothetical protein